jgi:hypothetical protein
MTGLLRDNDSRQAAVARCARASFRAVDDRIQRGARVIVAAATPAGCASDDSWSLLEEHLPSLLSIDRDAFVSTLFAGDGIQPIRWKLNLRGTGWPNVTAP